MTTETTKTALDTRTEHGHVRLAQASPRRHAAIRSDPFDPASTPAPTVRRALKAAIEVCRIDTRRRDEQKLTCRLQGTPLRVFLHDLVRAVGTGDAPVPWLLTKPDHDPEIDSGGHIRSRTILVGGTEVPALEVTESAWEHDTRIVTGARWESRQAARVTRPSGWWRELAGDLDAIDNGSFFTATLEARGHDGFVATASSDADERGKWTANTFDQKDQPWYRTGWNTAEITHRSEAGDAGSGKAHFAGNALTLLLRGAAASAGPRGEVTAHVETDRPLRLGWKCGGLAVDALLSPKLDA